MKIDTMPYRAPIESKIPREWLHMRLQLMLAKLEYKLSHDDSEDAQSRLSSYILPAICEMAMLAAEGELNGFASVCLRMAERVEPYRQQKTLPDTVLRALAEWMLHADRYLRRPSSRVRSSSLVKRLGDDAWGHPLGPEEQVHLLGEFAADADGALHTRALVSASH
jgi:hypothetical protein